MKIIRLLSVVVLSICILFAFFIVVQISTGLAAPTADILVNTLEDELNTDGDCSLREAIEAANSNSATDGCPAGETLTDTITFEVSGTIFLANQLEVSDGGPIIIDGGTLITASGNNLTRVFYLVANGELTLQSIRIIDGFTNDNGGGIYNAGTLTIDNSTIYSNTADGGAGLYNFNSSISTVIASNFISNTAVGGGGNISNMSDSTVIIRGGSIDGGTATDGGGIHNYGELTMDFTRLMGNEATNDGGGIWNDGTMTGNHIIFLQNHALEDGGGLANLGTLTATLSYFQANHAAVTGGGIINEGNLSIESSTFFSNTAEWNGAGLYNGAGGNATIQETTFTRNEGDYEGGAIWNGEAASLHLSQVNIISNTATHGAALTNEYPSTCIIVESTLADNSTDDYGAGIFNSGTLTFTHSTLSGNNTTAYYGGGMYNVGDVSIIESTISGNSAPWGGAMLNGGTVQIINSTLTENSAPDTGGVVNSNFVTLTNSIISSNPGGNCLWYMSGAFGDGGHNIEDTDTCGFSATGSMTNTNPLLGPLADNGGTTWTHALLAGSPAIDAADPTTCSTTDQRGVPRPIDGDENGEAICDIGSFEFQKPTTTTITSDDPDPSFETQTLTVTFSVTATDSVPTGTVYITFGEDEKGCMSELMDGSGYCYMGLTMPGPYTLTATYHGDPIHAPSIGTEAHTVIAYNKIFLPVILRE